MRYRALSTLAAVAALALFCGQARAESTTYGIGATRVAVAPALDGTLNDPLWKTGAHVSLGWNQTFLKPATDPTDVYVLADDAYLYVGWDVRQSEAVTATVHTDDVGLGADDVVRIYLWPGGDQGFMYFFAANPIGTRYAVSTENSAFAPNWLVRSARTPTGYTVTERIPLGILRGDGRTTWKVQFDRRIVADNGELLEWAVNGAQRNTNDVQFVGTISGMRGAAAKRPKARANLYTLGEMAAPRFGGPTSRAGADIAIPITATASLLATFHPDYSNVERDQQSISPTAFARQFSEVRPFFTQGANFYNTFNCNDCVGFPLLYTPNIPTPRVGFAVEGVQGGANFAAFDSLTNGRTDTAQALSYATADHHFHADFMRSSVDESGLHDVAAYEQLQVGNGHNFSVYETVGSDSGTLVPDPHEGRFREYGLNLYSPKSGFFAAYHDVGSQYGPIDSFTSINDVRGPSVYTFHEWDFDAKKHFVTSFVASQDVQRYKNASGLFNDTNYGTQLSITTRNLFYVSYSLGSQYLRFPGTPGEYANQNGLQISYNMNSSTPSDFSYYFGRFGQGYLRSAFRDTTVRLGKRATLTLIANDTNYRPDGGGLFTQWLEKASVGVQIDPHTSLAFGARRIVGTAPTYFSTPRYVNAINLSAAFYKRFGPSELYVVYGDPNSLRTKPDFIVKYILYVGAQKGT